MFDDLLIRKENCCVPQETEINNVRLANAYVPMQRLCETFEPLHGLRHVAPGILCGNSENLSPEPFRREELFAEGYG